MSEEEPRPPRMTEVLEAANRLDGRVRETPLERSLALEARLGVEVHLKLECQQRTGSFKLRGALNAASQMPPEVRARGLVTASAGNHGLGVALAARLTGASATIFVPETAAEVKQRRIARYGAELRRVPGTYDDAHHAAVEWAEEHDAVYLHAFSDPAVVAGQGTVGLEIFSALPRVRTLLVPVGGGGLIGGIGTVARALGPDTRVIGVQSVETASMHASLAADRLVAPPMGPTLCDGLAGDVDERSLSLAREVVDEMVLVEESAIRRAIRWLYEEEGVVAEGSGAVTVAALLTGAVSPEPGPVAVVVSGGNIDGRRLAEILSEGGE